MHIETIRFLVIFLFDAGVILAYSSIYCGNPISGIIFTAVVIPVAYFFGAYDCLHRPSFGVRITTQFILLFSFLASIVLESIAGISIPMVHRLNFWFIFWFVLNILLVPINILLRHLFPVSAVLVGKHNYERYLNLAQLLGFRIEEVVPFNKLGLWLNANSDEFGKVHGIESLIFTPLPKSNVTWIKIMAERYFIQFIVFRSSMILSYFIGFLFQNITVSPLFGLHRRIKRVVDFILVLILLLVTWPVFLLISVLIKVDSTGPVFFKHNRIGKNLRYFKLYKFRTMFNDAERKLKRLLDSDPEIREEFFKSFKLRNDPRVTKIGSILRKWSLDELPQLLNVLKGEMSLVGYRPIITDEIDLYKKKSLIVFWTTPGITGQWQTSGRSDTTYIERVGLDIEYLRHWSYAKDLRILLRTLPTVIRRTGAY
ncbi:MAG TPA: hypothetical protein EYP58_04010 [bacterium (Candidatus Stahlbacteria)]|nr:hypothetical protein [Candidatus Stahlbacteria bacterium]